MKFTPLPLQGSYLVDVEPAEDERGLFARTFCDREFDRFGLATRFVQCNVSLTRRRGMLRGMHLQSKPHTEAKLVRCVRGAAYDVLLDLRPESASFMKWQAVELGAAGRRAVYIPEGFAHGFQALSDDCELFYQMSAHYVPEAKAGVRWDDPAFGIAWPIADPQVSAADRALPAFDPGEWTRSWAAH